jgi:hypothetical protein
MKLMHTRAGHGIQGTGHGKSAELCAAIALLVPRAPCPVPRFVSGGLRPRAAPGVGR